MSKTNASVLILNQVHQPILAQRNGTMTRSLLVNFGQDTSAGGSCSLVWKNQFYVFGGNQYSTKNQISRLDGCMLNRIYTLYEFDFESGACTNFNDERLFLCFPQGALNKCWMALSILELANQGSYEVEFVFSSIFITL